MFAPMSNMLCLKGLFANLQSRKDIFMFVSTFKMNKENSERITKKECMKIAEDDFNSLII